MRGNEDFIYGIAGDPGILIIAALVIAMFLSSKLSPKGNRYLLNNYAYIISGVGFVGILFLGGSIGEAIFGAGLGWISGLFGSIPFRDAAQEIKEVLPKADEPEKTNPLSNPTTNQVTLKRLAPNSTQFKNDEYPETALPPKPIINDWLKEGNIRCTGCKKQDSPQNFLESSAGSNYKKCPTCNTHFQYAEEKKSIGVNITSMSCPKCKKSGSSNSFFQSDAGSDYAQCPECGMNFHI